MENQPISSREKTSFEKEHGRRPRILITNDDGPQEGVQKLAERLSAIADVVVAVPEKNYSETSYSKTPGKKTFTLTPRPELARGDYAYHTCDGTPVETVLVADAWAKGKGKGFDACISGPNHGWNIGDNLYPSGTFSAASMFQQLNPEKFAGALSLATQHDAVFFDTKHTPAEKPVPEWDTSAEIGFQMANAYVVSRQDDRIQRILAEKNIVLNVNVPNVPLRDLHPEPKWTKLGDRKFYAEKVENSDGRESFKIGTRTQEASLTNPTIENGIMEDVAALQQKYVTYTPVRTYEADAETLSLHQNKPMTKSSENRAESPSPAPSDKSDRSKDPRKHLRDEGDKENSGQANSKRRAPVVTRP